MVKPLFNSILVVINGSEASIHAAQYGILMARLYRCDMKAIYVVDTATLKELTISKFFVAEESLDYENSLTEDGKRYLSYVENLAKSKGIKIETELRKGSVWSEVVGFAEDSNVDLILLGEHQHKEEKDAITSTYKEIISHAGCSVLVVRQKNIEQLYKMA
ncbi:MAG: universal stress protein [Treponemataceae bacterium]|jgi:nucleotide-binding universal stress UspA family protein|nr:universal stress protein [Spirochaetaceae bacterium]MEE0878558.1 universal stress protein [Treponemataceae bacterium]